MVFTSGNILLLGSVMVFPLKAQTFISWFAKKLHLDLPPEPESTFDIHIPDEMSSSLNEVTLTAEMLAHGNTLAKMHIPQGHLAMMVKRGNQYMVPNGQLELHEGDTLLFISSNEHNPEA